MQDLDRLRDLADADRAARHAARHKTGRETLGVSPAAIEALVAEWRGTLDLEARLDLARRLWESDVHEARLAAARLLVQARIRPDDAAWQAILDWAPQIDGVEIGDAVMSAAARRLVARPGRVEELAPWAASRNPWLRRGLLTATAPWAKMNNPKPEDLQIRERILEQALDLAGDRHGAVRQAVEGWLRDLTRHDADRAQAWRAARDLRAAEDAAEDASRDDAGDAPGDAAGPETDVAVPGPEHAVSDPGRAEPEPEPQARDRQDATAPGDSAPGAGDDDPVPTRFGTADPDAKAPEPGAASDQER